MPEESVKLFISYCHRDEILRQQLDKHLAPLKGQKVIEAWHDRQIRAGEEWANQIDANLNKADIILLLISPDFVASDYCSKIELEQAVKRHENGEAIVVPVILEPCDWSWLPFAKFQAFPKDGKAIATWGNQNEAFLDVAQGIRKVAQELFAKRQQKAAQKEAVKARYLQKVEEALSDETISDIERDTLEELREELGLTLEETAEIETHAYEPYRKYEEDRNKYRKTLNKLIDKGDYPFSEEIKRDLELRQRDLGLKAEDVARIEQPILAEAEAKYQERLANIKRYQDALIAEAKHEYPLSREALGEMVRLQELLGLRDENLLQIQQEVEARFLKRSNIFQKNFQDEEVSNENIQGESPLPLQTHHLRFREEDIIQKKEQIQEEEPEEHQHLEQENLKRESDELQQARAEISNLMGTSFHKKEKLEEAITEYQKAIKSNPVFKDPYYNLGIALFKQEKWGEAITAFEQTIQLDPHFMDVYTHLGLTLSKQGNKEEAIAIWRQAVKLDPTFYDVYPLLGSHLLQQKKLEEAILALRQAIHLNHNSENDYYMLGIALFQQEKWEEAITAFEQTIQLDSSHADAYYLLGCSLAHKGESEAAVAAYQKSIQLDPQNVNIYSKLAAALYRQRKWEEAIFASRKAIQLNPKNPENVHIFTLIGMALHNQGKTEEAILEYEKAIQLNENVGLVYQNLALALDKQGQTKKAMEAYQKAEQLGCKKQKQKLFGLF
jgi:tetratricopeptide (TPR) repeat protein